MMTNKYIETVLVVAFQKATEAEALMWTHPEEAKRRFQLVKEFTAYAKSGVSQETAIKAGYNALRNNDMDAMAFMAAV